MTPTVVSGATLRRYRLAVAATAEYTQTYGGGTVSGALSAVTTTVNLVDAIFEREVAVRLTLIAGETSILFTDTTTDGYTSDDVNAMIGENQTKLDSVIGSANYDIGHVFDGHTLGGGAFSWQGVASIDSVCVNGSKARGVDIFRSVSPTIVFAYYTAAHEMGHQFGATHTFNANTGSCLTQRYASTAYEPANGSTIMAYRYACAPEDLMSLDTYFHNISIEQIVNFTTTGSGNVCAVPSSTGNNPPIVAAGPIYTIPMGTPFILTASGSDPNGDALTFGWEEFDLGAAAPPDTDDGSRPIFRSFAPVTSPSRTFPRLQDVLSGTATFGESIPTTTRTMNFQVTARDNRAGGGGVASAATQVNVNSVAGPFTVNQPSPGTVWGVGTSQSVNWSVAHTNRTPVSCANVKITLSTNGGTTFPIVLANSTPNDGSETITVPGPPSSNARIKVEGINNIFFNISQGFVISTTTPTPTPTPSATATPTATPATPTPSPCGTPPLGEGFGNIATLPGAGWVQLNHSATIGTTNWFQGNSAMFPSQSGAATSYIGANFNNTTGTNTISNWLLTPPLLLQNGAVMTFWTRTVDAPSFPDRLQVRMSTTGTSQNLGTTATDVGDFTTLLLDINPDLTSAGYPNVWTYFTVTVNGVTLPTTGRLAFRYYVTNGGPTGTNSDYIGIDTFQFSGPCGPTPTPGTPAPTATPTCTPRWSAGANFPATTVVRAVGNYFSANGRFYVMGGRSDDTPGSDLTRPLEYNPTANTWINKVATYPDTQVDNMACGVLTVGSTPQIYCMGGSAAGGTTTAARVFSYNPVTDTITTLTPADNWPPGLRFARSRTNRRAVTLVRRTEPYPCSAAPNILFPLIATRTNLRGSRNRVPAQEFSGQQLSCAECSMSP